MKILLIGSGGREHAMAAVLAKSPHTKQLFVAPGSDAMEDIATRVDVSVGNTEGLLKFAQDESIDLTVVGPEAPLVAGIADQFRAAGLKIFGPSARAAALEGSKVFSKNLLRKYHIPTGDYRAFRDPRLALAHVQHQDRFPTVIKADGLAAGKGVIIAEDLATANEAIERIMLHREFGEAGGQIVVEEFLTGVEASILAFTDGETLVPLDPAKDHKAVFDGDAGPNTGGMGAYCPSPHISPEAYREIEQSILIPTMHAMNREGIPYQGVLYAGLMMTDTGPKVLEYNVRLGDPEAQVLLARLQTDFVEIAMHTAEGTLDQIQSIEMCDEVGLIVILASEGYPASAQTGRTIRGLDQAAAIDGVELYHSGTQRIDGEWVTAGGRVLGVTALGANLEEARTRAYSGVSKIQFDGMHYRRDIGVLRGDHEIS